MILLDMICLAVFAVSAVRWYSERRELKRETVQFQRLAERMQGSPIETAAADTEGNRRETAAAQAGILPQYAALYQENPDLFGWLRIPDTAVNYPVMYAPEEPERYLHRAFDRSDSYCGTPFLDAECDPAGSFFLIYGHHMKDGSMFGSLPEYADVSYWMLHPEICLDTLYETRRYQIFAVFYASTDEDTDMPYYAYKSLPDRAAFEALTAMIGSRKLYDTGIEPEYGDSILLLSTCSYHTENGRLAVAATAPRSGTGQGMP